MHPTSKKYIFSKNIKKSECIHVTQMCKKKIYIYAIFTHKRGRMAIWIVTYLKTDLKKVIIKMFNLKSLSDTLWLAYIVNIQT